MTVEKKLAAMGIILPEPPAPVASYIPGLVCNNLAFISGQLPTRGGKLLMEGSLGREVSVEEGYITARQAAINCLGVLKSLVGDLDRVERIVRLTAFVQSAPGFHGQPQVANGASDLLQEVFGDRGKHTRVAVGVSALPLNAPCEIDLIAAIRP
ncbi:MAG: RidA family protein [Syntrophomonadaceae bacterium]|jgi:enamine deaminase RidA (YjgF/YER057c/UK114 family)|nr:RidA family protein [Syntrophomonadaceae bacterium]